MSMDPEAKMPTPRAVSRRAALTVLGASLALFCTVGFLNAFGVFQEHYHSGLLQDKSESDISWIGSMSLFFLSGLAPVSGVLVDRIGPRWPLVIGSLGLLVAIFTTSLCTQYYQFFLAQAVLLGASTSLLTWPPMAVVSRSLPSHRGLALGVVVGGSSIGGIIWPIMLARLFDHSSLSFGWIMRIVGFIMLPLLAIACVTVREPPPPPPGPLTPKSQPSSRTATSATPPSDSNETASSSGSQEDAAENSPLPTTTEKKKVKRSDIVTLLKRPVFIFLALGLGIGNIGLFIPLFFMPSYATSLGKSSQVAFYLIPAINAASLFGRVLPGYLADSYGHYNICIAALFASAITAFSWTAAKSLAGLIVVSLAYGFSSGAILVLQGACVFKIADRHMQGTAMGLLMGFLATASLVGSPIAGALIGRYSYLAASLFTGASLITGCLLLIVARLLLSKKFLASV
ncbi:putative MFS monocarboxylate transporter [Lasiosphaeria ovina]|uniref:MFS monocarboxylate transporter n=1 Tax=Lasiosphaeria ovina TaxID=92902 RepID=A0AAE0KDG7_9PEZI|nr:putative MFS monocarboxylate transporter [Lasiosphaeria ovina]